MKIAAVALVCVLSVAATAQAAEPARTLFALPQVSKLVSPSDTSGSESRKPREARADAPKATEVMNSRADAQSRGRQDSARRVEPPRVCFNATETREKIATHKLAEPFRALRAGRLQGEALRAKLCRWKADEFVYEVYVLRHDGRIVHVYMNAANGQSVGALNDTDKH